MTEFIANVLANVLLTLLPHIGNAIHEAGKQPQPHAEVVAWGQVNP